MQLATCFPEVGRCIGQSVSGQLKGSDLGYLRVRQTGKPYEGCASGLF